jgi:DNA polymerase epsilon subunit 2
MFVVLSDVWLDRPDSLANLQRLLEGFNSVEVVPTMFVFMGNFLSQPINTTHGNYEQYKGGRPHSLARRPPPRALEAQPTP